MLLSDICIKRPVFTIVLSLIIIAVGSIFFTKLQIRDTPDINPPIITVGFSYEGADALYMESQITNRVEKTLKTLKNLDFMSSESGAGNSNIILSFKLNSDIEVALNDVRSKISDISAIFPDDMKAPAISKMDSDNFPSIWISINSDRHDGLELTRIADNDIKSALEKLPAVGEAKIFGGKFYTMRIEPDNAKMFAHKISPFEIEQAIKAQNKDYPAGLLKTPVREFTLSLNASLNSPEEFANIIVKKYSDGTIVKLGDVAKIDLGPMEENIILRYNGKRSIAVGLIKQSTANIIDLSDSARRELEVIRKTLPAGVKLEIAYDGATEVKASIRAVFFTILEAIILVGLVTYVFLASPTITLIPLVTIPISLIGTFAAMYALGFSINTFTLLAMILAIGLVVDDAIVMLENIFRHHHELHKPPMESSFDASKEIGFAIIAMTITLASVFLPVGFIEGFLGKLFIEFAWTLAFCVLISGFVSLTLTPMMTSRMIAKAESPKPALLVKFDNMLTSLRNRYIYYLELAMDNKKKFYSLCVLSIAVLIVSFKFVGKTFVPEEDQGFLQVFFTGPEGSSVTQSEKTVEKAEEVMANHKDILGFFQVIGWGGSESAIAFVPLKDWSLRAKSQEQIRNDLNQKFYDIPGMSIFAISPRSIGGGGSGKVIEFNLLSSLEYKEIDKLSEEFINEMKKNPVFVNTERDFKSSTPTLDINVNREKAYRYGASLENIGRTVQYLIAGKQVGDFRMGNDIFDVILRYNQQNRNSPDDIKRVLVKSDNGNMLPIETVADIAEKITVKSYKHYNNSRSIGISSDLSAGYDISDAAKAIEELATKLVNNDNTKIEYLGEIKSLKESDNGSVITFLFALIFIFLVLSAQFESFADSLLILVAVPFSMTGGVVALLLFGDTINMYSNIGLITLIGLVTKNAIMLVEFTNQLREQGLTIKEAVIRSAKLRLRPILMTSIATICGAVPLVLAHGAGAASRNSIGLVIVGGMLVGTIFTIFVIPILYVTFKKESR